MRGIKKVDQLFVMTMAVYNLVRMRTPSSKPDKGRKGLKKPPQET